MPRTNENYLRWKFSIYAKDYAPNVTMLQAVQLGTVDILLTMLLLLGGVAGAQFGASMGTRLRGEETRALLGLLVLSVAVGLLWGLVRRPAGLFSAGPAL